MGIIRNGPQGPASADDVNAVIAAYVDAADAPGGTRLADWLRRYPAHTQALMDFALYWHTVKCEDPFVQDDPAAEAAFMRRAAEVARRMQSQQAEQSQPVQPAIVSIVQAAKERGLSTPELARALGVGPAEVVKLNQRLFRAASLPKALVARLAEALGRSVEQVAAYLRMPPTLSAQASYKADAAPRVGEQVDFLDAVAASHGMTPEQKAYWREQAAERLDEVDG